MTKHTPPVVTQLTTVHPPPPYLLHHAPHLGHHVVPSLFPFILKLMHMDLTSVPYFNGRMGRWWMGTGVWPSLSLVVLPSNLFWGNQVAKANGNGHH